MKLRTNHDFFFNYMHAGVINFFRTFIQGAYISPELVTKENYVYIKNGDGNHALEINGKSTGKELVNWCVIF